MDPDERTRSVLDPIHGLIRLTETEMKVIDHPLFQRLRNIKQNGLLYLLFPAATHTRFEHSLGVLYVAHGMLNSLVLNSMVGISKGAVRPRGDARIGEAVEFPPRDSDDGKLIYEITRLAALAHDLGHGPLSHTFDSFAPTRESLQLVLNDSALDALVPFRELLLKWGTDRSKPPSHAKNYRVPHEVMSCIFFAVIWHDLHRDAFMVRAVCAAILGTQGGEDAALLAGDEVLLEWAPLIHDVVASAPADADRMDYMERDSRSIGVSYGLFDRNRVLKSLLCYRGDDAGRVRYRLGVKQSGLKAIENLMQARYELFAQIYYHKTNRAVSRMLEAVGEIANQEMDLFRQSIGLTGWIERYLGFSDEQFMRLLVGATESDVSDRIRELGTQIAERRLWKRILDPTTRAEADEVLGTLRREFPEVGQYLQLDPTKPKALKDLDEGAALLIRNGAGPYETGHTKPWAEESVIIAALEKADEVFVRLYFDSADKEMAKKLRNRALELAFGAKGRSNAVS